MRTTRNEKVGENVFYICASFARGVTLPVFFYWLAHTLITNCTLRLAFVVDFLPVCGNIEHIERMSAYHNRLHSKRCRSPFSY